MFFQGGQYVQIQYALFLFYFKVAGQGVFAAPYGSICKQALQINNEKKS